MMLLWLLLIGCWLAVAAERYVKHERKKRATEAAFVAAAADEAHAVQRQREALRQAVEGAAADQPKPGNGLPEVTMQPNDQRT